MAIVPTPDGQYRLWVDTTTSALRPSEGTSGRTIIVSGNMPASTTSTPQEDGTLGGYLIGATVGASIGARMGVVLAKLGFTSSGGICGTKKR